MSEEFFLWWHEKIETLDVVVYEKPDTSEKNDEDITLNLVIVNKDRIFTRVPTLPFCCEPVKWKNRYG